jgi:hypothetical protein
MRPSSRTSFWVSSDIPLVAAAIVVTRLVRVTLECVGREVALEAVQALERATRGHSNRHP